MPPKRGRGRGRPRGTVPVSSGSRARDEPEIGSNSAPNMEDNQNLQDELKQQIREEVQQEFAAREELLRQELMDIRRRLDERPAVLLGPPAIGVREEQIRRQEIRRVIPEGGVTMFNFLKLGLPEFHGEDGEDPGEFAEQIEKVVKRLPCSDAWAIELVGLLLKGNAWTWFKDHIEGLIYNDAPIDWEQFRQKLTIEFLSTGERENRMMKFERLQQRGSSVAEYAKEFQNLCKYAKVIVPTEEAKINRFRRGLTAHLYSTLAAGRYTSLSELIDTAKQIEMKYKEERKKRDQRQK